MAVFLDRGVVTVMPMYDIAGLKVFMEPRFNKTLKQSEKYRIEENDIGKADIVLEYPERAFKRCMEKAPYLGEDSCEYMSIGTEFYKQLIKFHGILLHASAVVYDGKAYLFSAPSGTGKSTHTSLWLRHFGEDKAYILNDDKPAIRKIRGRFYACGTPFSGKVDMSRNEQVPLQGICVLKRGETNTIRKLAAEEAVFYILNQTFRPYSKDNVEDMLGILDEIVSEIPVYELKCNISEEAVEVAYERMK